MKKTMGSLALMACLGLGVCVFNSGCAGDRYSRSTGQAIDDTAITAKVKSELLADPDVKGLAVKVETYEGRVQLSGFVDTLSQKTRAGELARRVEGVKFVNNNLALK
jgi:hyperosmotically inducible periplasmic protein